jgi:hypothetical protein
MRSRSYSETWLFVWLRRSVFKVEKPRALAWGGWAKWDNELKSRRPVAYFATETLPDWLEKPAQWIIDPIYNLSYYLRNRFVRQTHLVHTDLEQGVWHEYETRILHGMFTELVDFVEVEQAWHTCVWDDKARAKYNMPWWRDNWLVYWREWRCPAAGIDYLKWCMTLDDPALPVQDRNPSQAEHAREVLTLYTWWKDIRATRPDEYTEAGFTEFNDRMAAKYGRMDFDPDDKQLTAQERREKTAIYHRVHEIEEARHQEDEAMMIRLVKIRRGLWT